MVASEHGVGQRRNTAPLVPSPGNRVLRASRRTPPKGSFTTFQATAPSVESAAKAPTRLRRVPEPFVDKLHLAEVNAACEAPGVAAPGRQRFLTLLDCAMPRRTAQSADGGAARRHSPCALYRPSVGSSSIAAKRAMVLDSRDSGKSRGFSRHPTAEHPRK